MLKQRRSLVYDKKGIAQQYIILIIMGFALLAIIGLWFIFSLVAPPLSSVIHTGVGALQTASQGDGNLSNAVDNSFVPVDRSLDNFKWIAYTLPFALLLMFALMASYVRTYPFLLPFWLAIVVVLVFISIYLGNAYQGASVDGTIYNYTANNFYMSSLPIIMSIIGVFGGVILLIVVSRDNAAEVVI